MIRRSTSTTLSLAAALAVGALVLAACGSSSTSSGGSAEAPMDLGGTSWNLSSYAGPDGSTVTATEAPEMASLTFAADGSWSGSTGCNRIAGTYTQDASSLTIEPGPMTLVACEGPVADQEQAMVAALPLVASFTGGDSLALLSADDSVLLTFAAGLASLAGTSWQATGVNNGQEAFVSPDGIEMATLSFDSEGQVSGSGGCNTFSGDYTTTDPDGLTFGTLASTMMACEDAVMQVEQQYLTALANVTTYQLEADQLTLRDDAGAMQATFRQAS